MSKKTNHEAVQKRACHSECGAGMVFDGGSKGFLLFLDRFLQCGDERCHKAFCKNQQPSSSNDCNHWLIVALSGVIHLSIEAMHILDFLENLQVALRRQQAQEESEAREIGLLYANGGPGLYQAMQHVNGITMSSSSQNIRYTHERTRKETGSDAGSDESGNERTSPGNALFTMRTSLDRLAERDILLWL